MIDYSSLMRRWLKTKIRQQRTYDMFKVLKFVTELFLEEAEIDVEKRSLFKLIDATPIYLNVKFDEKRKIWVCETRFRLKFFFNRLFTVRREYSEETISILMEE